MKTTLISPRTAAVTDGVEFDTRNAATVYFVSSGLAGSEECDIEVFNGQSFVPFRDSAGSVVTLTANKPNHSMFPGFRYRIKKDATVGLGGVIVVITFNN